MWLGLPNVMSDANSGKKSDSCRGNAELNCPDEVGEFGVARRRRRQPDSTALTQWRNHSCADGRLSGPAQAVYCKRGLSAFAGPPWGPRLGPWWGPRWSRCAPHGSRDCKSWLPFGFKEELDGPVIVSRGEKGVLLSAAGEKMAMSWLLAKFRRQKYWLLALWTRFKLSCKEILFCDGSFCLLAGLLESLSGVRTTFSFHLSCFLGDRAFWDGDETFENGNFVSLELMCDF